MRAGPEGSAGEADAVVGAFRERWAEAFARRDPAALAALYWPDALFYGSRPELFDGREGVRRYFSNLRADVVLDEFPAQQVRGAGPDTIITAGDWRFLFGGEPRPYRLTWTIVRRGGEWLIAAHHASPKG